LGPQASGVAEGSRANGELVERREGERKGESLRERERGEPFATLRALGRKGLWVHVGMTPSRCKCGKFEVFAEREIG